MSLLTQVCFGCSTLLILAVLTPASECCKPLRVCLLPVQHELNSEIEHHSIEHHDRHLEQLEHQGVHNSPLITNFTPKDKKYMYGPISVVYQPLFTKSTAISQPSIHSSPELDFRDIFKIPCVQKLLASAEDKAVRHVPVLEKVTRDVVDYRTRHIPVIKNRLRTVEEKYTEHVPITESIRRPVVDTIVKQVPVIEEKKRELDHRMSIPLQERVINVLLKLRQNPLYRQGAYGLSGLSCLCPQPYHQGYQCPLTKMGGFTRLK